MSFKFKVGDRVRVKEAGILGREYPDVVGEEAVVTRLGGVATPDEGTVVTNEKFPCGNDEYGEHGMWLPDVYLELI